MCESKNNDNDIGRFLQIAASDNKRIEKSLNLHQIRLEILGDCTGGFETIGDYISGEHKQTKAMRFKSFGHYESDINNIDMDYDYDDTTYSDYNYKLKTTEIT